MTRGREPPSFYGWITSKAYFQKRLDKWELGVKMRNPLLLRKRKSRSCGLKNISSRALTVGKPQRKIPHPA